MKAFNFLSIMVAVCALHTTTSPAATYVVTTTTDSGPGSLRQAILDANADTSTNDVSIEFNIPGSGVQTIAPLTPLPTITRPVTIDGYTQPGASRNTLAESDNAALLIELSGANLSGTIFDRGIFIAANDCTVRGLVINRFTAENTGAIWVQGGDNCVVEGNFIGTDASGMSSSANLQGLVLFGSGHRVGGLTPASRNVISGNAYGVYMGTGSELLGNFIGVGSDGSTAIPNTAWAVTLNYCTQTKIGGTAPGARNVISGNGIGIFVNNGSSNLFQGNFIGTDASGTLRRGNVTGLLVNESARNLVGGTDAGAGNLISGNTGEGLRFDGYGATENLATGNLIGTDVTGTLALGNGNYGVLYGGVGNLLGGIDPSARNVIAGSGVGVGNYGGTNNAVLGNSIFGNGLGIDLGSFSPADLGPTPNDSGDADDGANHYQNFPDISSVKIAGRNLKVDYKVDSSAANSAYPFTIEFFIADGGQGRTFIHRATYSTPQAVDSITFKPSVLPAAGDKIVATATDKNGNTSEFSAPIAVERNGK